MRTEQFFEHHGIVANPFAEEDAQTDPVFKSRCRDTIFHPAWDKVYGDPSDPATSLVFGEKGAGKTAMRLQVLGRVAEHNAAHPSDRVWIVQYDDFNPFLDRFADRLSTRKRRDPARVLAEWKLWDHMDAILAIAVTELVDNVLDSGRAGRTQVNKLGVARPAVELDHAQQRDLLLLAACYDDSTAEPFTSRWARLRRTLRFPTWRSWTTFAVGVVATVAVLAGCVGMGRWDLLLTIWPYLAVLVGWAPWLWRTWRTYAEASNIARRVRVLRRDRPSLRALLASLPSSDLENQPLPTKQRTDDRYELLAKLQGVLRTLGATGVMVLVDRVDEPHLVKGDAKLMRDLVWSLLDNKFLKQPGLGVKLLLPAELYEHVQREDRDFHQRARLDKQNMIPSLDWTGEALCDLTNARLAACAKDGTKPTVRALFAEDVSQERLVEAFRSLRTPRHLFKFLYRLISTHCGAYTDDRPEWRIPRAAFETSLAVYSREQAAVDRGLAGL